MTEVSLAARASSSSGPSSLELLTTVVKDRGRQPWDGEGSWEAESCVVIGGG